VGDTSRQDDSLEQVLKHEAMERARRRRGESEVEVRCECMRRDCDRTFTMPADDFRRIRYEPGLYILSAEHAPTLVEEVVEQTEEYLLVRNEALFSALAAGPSSG
jgi:hypothetical protein